MVCFVDLLIETIHTIGACAERKIDRELLEDLKRVTGKQNVLFALAEATLNEPFDHCSGERVKWDDLMLTP